MDGKALTDIHRDNDYFLQYISKLFNCYQEIIIHNHLQHHNLIQLDTTGICAYSL
jgi:hypothetical protein